jgi:hypothetical protein
MHLLGIQMPKCWSFKIQLSLEGEYQSVLGADFFRRFLPMGWQPMHELTYDKWGNHTARTYIYEREYMQTSCCSLECQVRYDEIFLLHFRTRSRYLYHFWTQPNRMLTYHPCCLQVGPEWWWLQGTTTHSKNDLMWWNQFDDLSLSVVYWHHWLQIRCRELELCKFSCW